MSQGKGALDLSLLPRQWDVADVYQSSIATKVGYGGSRGGAKSHFGRTMLVKRRWEYPNTVGWIIRKTLDDIKDNHVRPLLYHEQRYMEPWYNKQEKVITFPNGSLIRFISSDNYDDIFQLYGKEAADIFLDQAEQFSQEQIEFLSTCNRCTTNVEIVPKMLLTFNPGGVGHTYLRRVFVEKQYEANEDPSDFAFVEAKGWDNAMWSIRNLSQDGIGLEEYYGWSDDERFRYFLKSDYGKKLDRLPDSQRRAHLLGDWYVFEGQFFSMWRTQYHVIKAEDFKRDAEWPVLGAIDYGQRTVLEVGVRDYDGRIVMFAECYSEHEMPQDRFSAMADVLLAKGLYGIHIKCDTNMSINLAHYTGYDKTPITIANEVFDAKMGDKAPILSTVSKSSTDNKPYRVAVNEAVKSYLSWRKGLDGALTARPRLFFTDECKWLIKTMPELLHDPESMEGMDFTDDGVDDPYDAMKYAFMGLYQPMEEKREKPAATVSEHMARLIHRQMKMGNGQRMGAHQL